MAVNKGVTNLNTTDGEKVRNSNQITETDPTVPPHVKQITTDDISSWDSKLEKSTADLLYVAKWEKWLEDFTAKKDILIENTTSSTINGKINNTGIFEGYNFVFNGVDGSGGASGGGSAAIWGLISGTLSDQTDLQNALDAKANTSHTHTISNVTGLQSALDGKEPAFTKNTAFNKNFGTGAGTVAEGNDSRINNGQTAFGWGDHALVGYLVSSDLSNYVDKTSIQGISGRKTITNNRLQMQNDSSSILRFSKANDTKGGYVGYIADSEIRMYNYTGGGNFAVKDNGDFEFTGTGNVGIGTTSPSEKLDVAGSAIIDADLTVGNELKLNGTAKIDFDNNFEIRRGQNTGGLAIRTNSNVGSNAPIFAVESSGGATRFGVTQTNGGFFRDNLRVGYIHDDGVINNTSYMLDVNGDINSQGVVTATNFVFG